LLLLLLLGFLLLQIPAVQSYAGKQVKNYIASRIDTPFEIEDIEINIYDRVKLSGVYIEDEKGDTLLYASELFVNLDAVSLLNRQVTAQDIRISDGKIRLKKDESGSNFDFLLKEFVSADSTDEKENEPTGETAEDANENPWDIAFGNLNIINTDIIYEDATKGESLHLYAGNIDIDARETNLNEKLIAVDRATLADLKIDYVQGGSDEEDETDAPPFRIEDIGWDINVNTFEIKNSEIAYADQKGRELISGQMNFKKLSFNQVNVLVKDIKVQGDSLFADLAGVSAMEHSGFELKNLSTDISMTSKNMKLDDLLVQSSNSEIGNSATLKYKSFEDFRDFGNKVFFTLNADKNRLRLQDLKYFLPADVMTRVGGIVSTDEEILLDGKFKGRVANFRATDLVIRAGQNTYYEGSVKWRGLPDFQNSFIDFRVNELRTRAEDIQSLMVDFDMPQEFKNLGDVSFKGTFTGFPKDFVADGKLVTVLGTVDGDINMKAKGAIPKYSGYIGTESFELGKFLNREDEFGAITLHSRVRGQGFKLDELDAHLDGVVDHISIRGTDYSNITLDGRFEQRLFTGNVDVNDENLTLDFAGAVDFNEEEPVFTFDSQISDANLKKWNWSKDDLYVSTLANLALTGSNIDNIKGTASFQNISIRRGDREELIDEVKLYSVIDESTNERLLQLDSEYFIALVEGKFDLRGLAAAFQNYINHYFPMEFRDGQITEEQDIDFEIEILKPITFADLLVPKVNYVSEGLLDGQFNSIEKKIDLDFSLDSLVYDTYRIDEFALQANSNADKITFESHLNEVDIGDQLTLPDVKLTGDLKDYKLDFDLTVSEDDPENGVDIAGVIESNFKSANLTLDKMDVRTRGLLWKGQLEEAYFNNREDYFIKNFVLAHNDQSLRANSVEVKGSGGPVQILLNDFKLDEFASIAKKDHLLLKGTSNGEISIEQLFLNPVLTGDLNVEGFEFLGKPLGNLDIHSKKLPGVPEIEVNGTLSEYGNDVVISGKYYTVLNPDVVIQGKPSQVDLNVQVKALQLEWLEALMGTIITDTKGFASGSVKLYGDIKQPSLHGTMRLENAEARVIFLNNVLSLDKQVLTLRDKKILFENTSIADRLGNEAIAEGYLDINDYKNPAIDVSVISDHFLFLETSKGDNSTFYGTAFGDGSVSFSGPLRDLNMNIKARSHPGTKISFPLEDEEQIIENQHVFTFIENITEADEVEEAVAPDVERNLEVDLELEVTEDAELEIIFDQAAGDIIRSKGTGDISVNYHSRGDFNVYGTYTITEGDYLFTLKDFVKKEFSVKPNGTVSFFGSPYDAKLDVNAVYSLKTTLSGIFSDGTGEGNTTSQRVPVDVNLLLGGTLADTDVRFAIELPDLSSVGNSSTDVQAVIDGINNDADTNELNSQVFGLLVLNNFMPSNVLESNELIEGGVNATVSEFVSDQFSKLLNETLNEFIPDSDFSIKWRRYNGENADDVQNLASGNEFELLYNQRLFNNRVSIDIGGNVDVGKNIGEAGTSNIAVAGDFIFQYLITPEGNIRLKVYGKNTQDTFTDGNTGIGGISLFASEEFDDIEDLRRNFKKRRAQRKLRQRKRAQEKAEALSTTQNGNN